MIMTMFRHDHGMIIVRSCHGGRVFPTRVTPFVDSTGSSRDVDGYIAAVTTWLRTYLK